MGRRLLQFVVAVVFVPIVVAEFFRVVVFDLLLAVESKPFACFFHFRHVVLAVPIVFLILLFHVPIVVFFGLRHF